MGFAIFFSLKFDFVCSLRYDAPLYIQQSSHANSDNVQMKTSLLGCLPSDGLLLSFAKVGCLLIARQRRDNSDGGMSRQLRKIF